MAQLIGDHAQGIDAQPTWLTAAVKDKESGEIGADGEQFPAIGEGDQAQHPENETEGAESQAHVREPR
ncbi:hypothetical protein D3C84_1156250 [compost metagenome]